MHKECRGQTLKRRVGPFFLSLFSANRTRDCNDNYKYELRKDEERKRGGREKKRQLHANVWLWTRCVLGGQLFFIDVGVLVPSADCLHVTSCQHTYIISRRMHVYYTYSLCLSNGICSATNRVVDRPSCRLFIQQIIVIWIIEYTLSAAAAAVAK